MYLLNKASSDSRRWSIQPLLQTQFNKKLPQRRVCWRGGHNKISTRTTVTTVVLNQIYEMLSTRKGVYLNNSKHVFFLQNRHQIKHIHLPLIIWLAQSRTYRICCFHHLILVFVLQLCKSLSQLEFVIFGM